MRIINITTILLLFLFAMGCEIDRSFYIFQNNAPNEKCSLKSDETLFRTEGFYDIRLAKEDNNKTWVFGAGYWFYPLIKNELPPLNKSTESGYDDVVDPNLVSLREFVVDIDLGSIKQNVNKRLINFTYPATGVVEPGGGKRVQTIKIIPEELAEIIEIPKGARPRIIVGIYGVGDTSLGEVTTPVFYYPITLCDGCMVTVVDSCDRSTWPTDAAFGSTCGIPQEGFMVCCHKTNGDLLCY